MKKRIKVSKSALLFYIMAALSLGIFIYTVYNVTTYLQSAATAGQFAWSDIPTVISYYINNTFVYLVDTLIFVGIGYIINLLKNKAKQENNVEIIEKDKDIADEEDDEFFKELTEEPITNKEEKTEEEIK